MVGGEYESIVVVCSGQVWSAGEDRLLNRRGASLQYEAILSMDCGVNFQINNYNKIGLYKNAVVY